MLFGARRHAVYAQRLVALDEISGRLIFDLPARVGRKLGGKGAQPVESTGSAQIRRCDESALSTALHELERGQSH